MNSLNNGLIIGGTLAVATGVAKIIQESRKTLDNILLGSESPNNILARVQEIAVGLILTDVGSYFMGLDDEASEELIFQSLFAATQMLGLNPLYKIWSQSNGWGDRIAGLAFLFGGSHAIDFGFHFLGSKTIAAAARALPLIFLSFDQLHRGTKDLVSGRCFQGGLEIGVGIAGTACLGYYFFDQFSENCAEDPFQIEATPNPMPPHLKDLLFKYSDEIEHLYQNKTVVGQWKELGAGISKQAYIHKDFNDQTTTWVLKIPKRQFSFWSWFNQQNDAEVHYHNVQSANKIISKLKLEHVTVPKSYLAQSSQGSFVVEQRFALVESWNVPNNPSTRLAHQELDVFIKQTGLCDVAVYRNHNAGFIKDRDLTRDATIGVFDLDCSGGAAPQVGAKTSLLKHAQGDKIARSIVLDVASTLGAAEIVGEFFIPLVATVLISIAIDEILKNNGNIYGGCGYGAVLAIGMICTTVVLEKIRRCINS